MYTESRINFCKTMGALSMIAVTTRMSVLTFL